MTLTISIAAILISLASLAFNLYQFKNTKNLKRLKKVMRYYNKPFCYGRHPKSYETELMSRMT